MIIETSSSEIHKQQIKFDAITEILFLLMDFPTTNSLVFVSLITDVR